MYPYGLDGIPDKGNILGKNSEDLICDNLSKIIIDRKAKKRNIEWVNIDKSEKNKRYKKEIIESEIIGERKLKRLKIKD